MSSKTKTPATPPPPLTVITTHLNADFDAMASMLAAQKLYPDALVVFPGSQERNLRNFFINSMAYLFNMADIGTIDLTAITRLVLVDTRQPHRIGRFQQLIDQPGVEIIIYDHHPAAANDIAGTRAITHATGANVTILVEIICEKKIAITADEATIMCLGIYEDTGSFTYNSTTERDFKAAAYLLGQGANLNVVTDLITRDMNPEQITLLNDLIQAAVRYNINGVEVWVGEVTRERYVPDFAFLVQKIMRMESMDAIFAIARMEHKIYVVARSRISEVDVGNILTPLGGGGHSYAAAATVRDKTLAQVQQRLMDLLQRKVRSRRQARHLMSSPAISAPADTPCREANQLLTRYNINALLVTATEAKAPLAGYITRQVLEKTSYHQLDQLPVGTYMTTEVACVGPDADLEEIQEKIIGHKQRVLPVMQNDQIVGVITRTDLLNTLVRRRRLAANDPSAAQGVTARTKIVVKFMRERLSAPLLDTLRKIGEVAADLGFRAYVVGGFVRDLFLYRSNEDIDIVIEGDGIEFARKYTALVNARIHTYQKFGTAVIIRDTEPNIDVASARLEYYQFPAALPTVEFSSIKMDLFRRDFTVNTLAIQLTPDRFGTLIDFFAAQKDLKERTIRVLHNLSFVEDPTRVFRAIRFEQRFGFSIGKLTLGLIQNAVQMDFFKRLSGRRVFSELRLIFEEENPHATLVRLNDFGLLSVIHPSIRLTHERTALLKSVKEVLSWYDLLFIEKPYVKWMVYFLAITRGCNRPVISEICQRFELAPKYQVLFMRDRFVAEKAQFWLERQLKAKNSDIYAKLDGLRTEIVLYLMASTRKKTVKMYLSKYLTRLKKVRIQINGKYLKSKGLIPGPAYREILQAVFRAKLNGQLPSLKEEQALADRLIIQVIAAQKE